MFHREAESAREAVSTAIADVKRAIPDATLEEADIPEAPDLADLCLAEQRLQDIRSGKAQPVPLDEVIQRRG